MAGEFGFVPVGLKAFGLGPCGLEPLGLDRVLIMDAGPIGLPVAETLA